MAGQNTEKGIKWWIRFAIIPIAAVIVAALLDRFLNPPPPTPTPTPIPPTATATHMATPTPTASHMPTPTATPTIPAPPPVAKVPRPSGIVVDPQERLLYVNAWDNNSTYVVDGTTHNVIKTIHVGKRPFGIDMNPNTGKVYVANFDSSTVSVISTSTKAVIKTIPLGANQEPCHVAVNPDSNRVYVALHGGGSVAIIDGGSDTLLNKKNMGKGTFGVAVNRNTNVVYVANRDAGNVVMMDGGTGNILGAVKPGGAPFAVAVNRGTGRFYVTYAPKGNNPSRLAVYEGNGSFVTSLGLGNGGGPNSLGTEWVNVNSDANRVYVTNSYDNTFYMINGNTSKVDMLMTQADGIGVRPSGIGVNASLCRVYVGNFMSDTVIAIDDPGCLATLH